MNVLVTGGAGYLGSVLVPALLERGHDVTVVDWFLYGQTLEPHERLTCLKHDIRQSHVIDAEAAIHLACVSNDPSFDLDPDLGKSVNYDATLRLVRLAQQSNVQRFIFASSSSVYGIKPEGVAVTEGMELQPLTDYSRYKAECEPAVLAMGGTVLRPATLCGYSPRQRLDLVVNALTAQAVCEKTIAVHGGSQSRANLHVQDMARAYIAVLEAPVEQVAGQVFNVGAENLTVAEIAKRVQAICGGKIKTAKTTDPRSYVINSDLIKQALGFTPEHTLDEAIAELKVALTDGRLLDAMKNPIYRNIEQMQLCHIS